MVSGLLPQVALSPHRMRVLYIDTISLVLARLTSLSSTRRTGQPLGEDGHPASLIHVVVSILRAA